MPTLEQGLTVCFFPVAAVSVFIRYHPANAGEIRSRRGTDYTVHAIRLRHAGLVRQLFFLCNMLAISVAESPDEQLLYYPSKCIFKETHS